jgi:hypothetical protein
MRGFFISLVLASTLLGACTTTPDRKIDDYENAAAPPEEPDTLEKTRKTIGTSVGKLANRMDAFFAGSRAYDETRGNYAQLNLLTLWQDTGALTFNSTVEAKLVFPRTEERWKLLIETDRDRDQDSGDFVDDPLSAVTESDYRIGLRYLGKKVGEWDLRFDGGAVFAAPIDLFVRTRARRYFRYGIGSTRLAQTLTAYTSQKQEALTEIDFDRLIDENRLFRYGVEFKLSTLDTENLWRHGPAFYHRWNKTEAMQYQVGMIGRHTPASVTDYFANVRYRRQLKRKWLFIELTPEYRWETENNFDPRFYLLFKIEAVFKDS